MDIREREFVCINDKLMAADQAHVSVFDSGFMQGIGLFETMRTYGDRVFRLDQHLERLQRSARALGWTVIPQLEQMHSAVMRVVGATEQSPLRVRLTVTTGTLRATQAEDVPRLTVVASATVGADYPPELKARGVTVVLSNFRQGNSDPTIGHKTTSYFNRLAGLRDAHSKGAFEALWFTYTNRLAEGSISNVFLVSGGALRTPPLDTPILPGITRATVLELAQQMQIDVREEPLTVDELLEADEVFLTSSLMEIVPVVRVEREAIATEKPGELTQALQQAYRRLVFEETGFGGEEA